MASRVSLDERDPPCPSQLFQPALRIEARESRLPDEVFYAASPTNE
jgi:hypothetical protein